jgi:transposase
MWAKITRLKYERAGQRYASDLTDAEWAVIEPHMPAVKPLGRPRETDLRAVLDGILYIARAGCHWRMLPKDFPPFTTVQGYFYDWRGNGLFEPINFELLLEAREQHEESRAWLEAVLSGPDLVRFAWLTLWAFFRIATNPRVFRTTAFHVRGRSGDFLLARPGGRRDFRPGRAALGHPARPCARRTRCRSAGHGRCPRRNRARAWRYGLHNRSRLLAVSRAQMDKPPRGKPLTEREYCHIAVAPGRSPHGSHLRVRRRAADERQQA